MPGTKNSAPGDPVNVCKFMLYQDPLIQLFEADTAGLRMAEHFAMLEGRYARYAEENPAYELMFRSYAALARALALKCAWHEQAGEAVRSGDREKVGALAAELPETIAAVDALRVIWRRLWESTNKPNGFEIIDVRLGRRVRPAVHGHGKGAGLCRRGNGHHSGAVRGVPGVQTPAGRRHRLHQHHGRNRHAGADRLLRGELAEGGDGSPRPLYSSSASCSSLGASWSPSSSRNTGTSSWLDT